LTSKYHSNSSRVCEIKTPTETDTDMTTLNYKA